MIKLSALIRNAFLLTLLGSVPAAIAQQDADTFHQLLTLFNGITMSERLIFPTLMRQIYQAFDRFTKDHDQLALDHTIDAVFTVIQPNVTPFNDQEVHQQVQLLRDWLSPKH